MIDTTFVENYYDDTSILQSFGCLIKARTKIERIGKEYIFSGFEVSLLISEVQTAGLNTG